MSMIRIHSGLERRGGASRVARLLCRALKALDRDVHYSCEFAESPDAPPAMLAKDVGASLSPDDILHLHATSDWSALLAGLPEKRKVVITLHDASLLSGGCVFPLNCDAFAHGCVDPCPHGFPEARALRAERLALLRRVRPVLAAPSRWMADMAESATGLPVTVIPNGIPWPEDIPRKSAARRELGIHPAARIGLFVAHGGKKAAYKSGPQWQELWQRISKQVPGSLAFAVGGDTEERQGNLLIWPYVERGVLSRLMAAADVLLYPTRADNHSMIILESMSCALPVLSYAVGGVPEQIDNRETGLLVPPGNADAFVNAAVSLLADPVRTRQLGSNAFDQGKAKFRLERMAAGYRKLYR